MSCAFCDHVLTGNDGSILQVTDVAAAFRDSYPSTKGHTLIIPKRHVSRVEDLTGAEYAAVFTLARQAMRGLSAIYEPDGFTIGINDGAAAGQTVAHVHLHVIPRRDGDTADPRGGIRWAIPETAAYWAAP